MKNLLNTTAVTLALVTIFASAALAGTPADEYEFTALDNDVMIEYPSSVSHEDCNSYAALQNQVDLVLSAFQYDSDISEAKCAHPEHAQELADLNLEQTLVELGFDG